jgi:hypothetical protein
MPTWCRYCHKEGHTKFDSPLSKARIICYSCHQQSHRSYECPRRRNVPTNLHNQTSNQETQQENITINTITIESEDESNDPNYTDGDESDNMSILTDGSAEKTIDSQLKEDS